GAARGDAAFAAPAHERGRRAFGARARRQLVAALRSVVRALFASAHTSLDPRERQLRLGAAGGGLAEHEQVAAGGGGGGARSCTPRAHASLAPAAVARTRRLERRLVRREPPAFSELRG